MQVASILQDHEMRRSLAAQDQTRTTCMDYSTGDKDGVSGIGGWMDGGVWRWCVMGVRAQAAGASVRGEQWACVEGRGG
jgi:hypothetical protein